MGKKVKTKGKFTAYGYRAYTRRLRRSRSARPTIPGPLIEANVGDTVVVNFRTSSPTPVTIHPHGVLYSADMDGAYKGKYTDPGGFVQKGETFHYVWEAVPGTEGIWIYHDHGPLDPLPLYKGLFGPMIVRARRRAARRQGVLRLLPLLPARRDRARRAVPLHQRPSYAGNTPTYSANVGDTSPCTSYAIDDDFHTFHIHGHRWEDAGRRRVIDNVTLGPGDSFTARVTSRTTRAAGSTTATSSPTCTRG